MTKTDDGHDHEAGEALTDTEMRGQAPAYPVSPFILPNGVVVHYGSAGMSMRDAAALAALQGLASNFTTLGAMGKEAERRGTEPADVLAVSAWEIADAFIAARETKET